VTVIRSSRGLVPTLGGATGVPRWPRAERGQCNCNRLAFALGP
jgi:hypothetical protein